MCQLCHCLPTKTINKTAHSSKSFIIYIYMYFFEKLSNKVVINCSPLTTTTNTSYTSLDQNLSWVFVVHAPTWTEKKLWFTWKYGFPYRLPPWKHLFYHVLESFLGAHWAPINSRTKKPVCVTGLESISIHCRWQIQIWSGNTKQWSFIKNCCTPC